MWFSLSLCCLQEELTPCYAKMSGATVISPKMDLVYFLLHTTIYVHVLIEPPYYSNLGCICCYKMDIASITITILFCIIPRSLDVFRHVTSSRILLKWRLTLYIF